MFVLNRLFESSLNKNLVSCRVFLIAFQSSTCSLEAVYLSYKTLQGYGLDFQTKMFIYPRTKTSTQISRLKWYGRRYEANGSVLTLLYNLYIQAHKNVQRFRITKHLYWAPDSVGDRPIESSCNYLIRSSYNTSSLPVDRHMQRIGTAGKADGLKCAFWF